MVDARSFSANGLNHLIQACVPETAILSQGIVHSSKIKQSLYSVHQLVGSGTQTEATGPVFFYCMGLINIYSPDMATELPWDPATGCPCRLDAGLD